MRQMKCTNLYAAWEHGYIFIHNRKAYVGSMGDSHSKIQFVDLVSNLQVLPVMETHQWHMQILTTYNLFGGDTITNTIMWCM